MHLQSRMLPQVYAHRKLFAFLGPQHSNRIYSHRKPLQSDIQLLLNRVAKCDYIREREEVDRHRSEIYSSVLVSDEGGIFSKVFLKFEFFESELRNPGSRFRFGFWEMLGTFQSDRSCFGRRATFPQLLRHRPEGNSRAARFL